MTAFVRFGRSEVPIRWRASVLGILMGTRTGTTQCAAWNGELEKKTEPLFHGTGRPTTAPTTRRRTRRRRGSLLFLAVCARFEAWRARRPTFAVTICVDRVCESCFKGMARSTEPRDVHGCFGQVSELCGRAHHALRERVGGYCQRECREGRGELPSDSTGEQGSASGYVREVCRGRC